MNFHLLFKFLIIIMVHILFSELNLYFEEKIILMNFIVSNDKEYNNYDNKQCNPLRNLFKPNKCDWDEY